MSVAAALQQRVSTRAFLPTPVPAARLRELFAAAQQAPSNCNVQPWQVYVASGRTRDRLRERLVAAAQSGQPPCPEFDWGMKYDGIHRERQIGAAVALYGALGIGRQDRAARERAMLRNWEFYDAPHAAFFAMDRRGGMPGAVDLGIYAQGLALLLAEAGIASCLQGSLNHYPGPVRELLGIPDHLGILFGMCFGYADPEAPANRAHTRREPLENSVVFAD